MASLKVWHFIPSPFAISDSLISISYNDYLNAVGYGEWTGWSLPDVSIMEHAPTEYIGYLLVKYRSSNTSGWTNYPQIIRYNNEAYGRNILAFLPYSIDQSTYVAAHLEGMWKVTIDSTNNRWKIDISTLAYTYNESIQSPQNSDVINVDVMSIRGINIYY